MIMKQFPNRLESLDALRGFDMMFIMGVSSLVIAICQLFPGGDDSWLVHQMGHCSWNGLTHHDTIFPLFLFLAGVSWPFSLSKQRAAGKSTGRIVGKVLRRALILIALGVVYNGFFKFDFANLRVASVLGRIGLAWMGAALIYMFVESPWKRGVICAAILIGYWLLVRFVQAPDMPSGSDPLSMQGSIVGWVDRMLMPGKLIYDGGRFDPEGLLGTFPAIVSAMLGMFAGDLVRLPQDKMTGGRKTLWLLVAAVACLALGLLWSLDFPINKKLWSSSFVLVVASYCFACFALFYYLIDVKGHRKWAFPLKVIGMNSITIYMLQKIVSIPSINRFFLEGLAGLFSPGVGKVIFAIGYVLICWLILYFLYKKEVFLKV